MSPSDFPSWEHPQNSPFYFTCAGTYTIHSVFFQISKDPLHRQCLLEKFDPQDHNSLSVGNNFPLCSHQGSIHFPLPQHPITTPPALPFPPYPNPPSRHASLTSFHHSLYLS